MNKKGFIYSSFSLMLSLFILVLVMAALVPIKNQTATKEEVLASLDNSSITTLKQFKINQNETPLNNILSSFLGFVIYSSFEITKLGVNYAAENQDLINPINLIWLILLFLLTPVIFTIFKIIILIWILIKDWKQSKNEKLYISKLKEDKCKQI